MEQSGVNIVLADRGWVLERLGQAIRDRHPDISISNLGRPEAALQYYVNYSAWRGRISPVEVAYFTHIEQNELAMRRFFEVATSVDHCVCHSEMYARILREYGVQHVTVISPGIDLEKFRPQVKIGVVGRTYASGRKGETLIEQVLDTEGVEWHFTGEGWPAPSRRLTDEDLPKFLNEMDYVLVPSLYEGGPLSLVEALACGVPVISPNVGWAEQFPHYEFKTGDVADLRRVLRERVAERQVYRTQLKELNWNNWADQHVQLFQQLLSARGLSITPLPPAFPGSPILTLHGSERKSRGGPSIRVPATARAIREIGVDAKCVHFPDHTLRNASLIHGFNVWDLKSSVDLARYAVSLKKPFVFSPIYLAQNEAGLWQREIPAAARRAKNSPEFNDLLHCAIESFQSNSSSRAHGAIGGYDATVRTIIDLADGVIFLSEQERKTLEVISAKPRLGRVVRNGVDPTPFASATGALFQEHFGVRDYVLCVGRLEWRKNQLLLLHTLRGLNVPIVLIGGTGDDEYRFHLEALRTQNVHILGHIENSNPLLASAYAGARVVVQPSWCEGAPIAALEAAAAGAKMVLSNRSAEREYFGDFARYCDPSRPEELREIILDCYETSDNDERKHALKKLINEEYNLQKHARETLSVYWETINSIAKPDPHPNILKQSQILIDLTGCGRLESSFLNYTIKRELLSAFSSHGNHKFVCWSPMYRRFVELGSAALENGDTRAHADFMGSKSAFLECASNASILVMGEEWLADSAYLDDLLSLAYDNDLKLSALIRDADGLQQDGLAEAPPRLHPNFHLLISNCSDLVTFSGAIARKIDLLGHFHGVPIPPVRTLPIGTSRALDRINARASVDHLQTGENGYALVLAGEASVEGEKLIIKMWQRLYEKMEERPLLILATPGTNETALQQEIDLAPGVRHLIYVPEADLPALVAGASLLIAAPESPASIYSFLSEGLRQSKACIAPPLELKGATPGIVEEIDDLDLRQWSARILYYMRSPTARNRKAEQIRNNFQEARWCATITSWIEGLSVTRAPAAGNIVIGHTYNFSRDATVVRKRPDWNSQADGLVQEIATNIAFSLSIASPPRENLILLAEARTNLAERQEGICEVFVNDRHVGRWAFKGMKWNLFSAELPQAYFGDCLRFDVKFRLRRWAPPSHNDAGPGHRAPPLQKMAMLVANTALVRPVDTGQNNYSSQQESLDAILNIGSDIDLTRYAFALDLLSDAGMVYSDWGLRDAKGKPQLVLHFLQQPSCRYQIILRYRAVATHESPLGVTVVTRDGVVLGMLEASDDEIHEAILSVPEGGFTQPLQLEFLGLKPVSPKEMGLGVREEPFGIGFFGVRVELDHPVPKPVRSGPRYRLGQILSFQLYDSMPNRIPARQYMILKSWHIPEPEGTWSLGSTGFIVLFVDDILSASLRGEIVLSTWAPLGDATTISILVNDITVSTNTIYGTEDVHVQFLISRELLRDGRMELGINSDRVFTPSLEGLASDDRKLGVRLKSLSFTSGHDDATLGSNA